MAKVKEIEFGIINSEREIMIASPRQNVPRDRVLGVGIVGCGAIAQRSHIPNFQKVEGAKVVAVCDVNEQKARLVARQWGIEDVFTRYEDLINCEKVDIVSICTPHYLHKPMAIAACKAKKHVLIEKPATTTVDDARKIIEEARKNNVKVACANFRMFLPVYELAKDVIESGMIGEPLTFRAKMASPGPEFWTPATGEWFYNAKQAQMGALLDLGIKDISLLRWLFSDEIAWVMGTLRSMVKERGTDVEDHAVAILGFRSGVTGVLEASWCTTPSFKGTEIVGTRGTIFVDYPNTRLEIHLGGKVNAVVRPDVPEESLKGNPFQRFVDWVLGETPSFEVTLESELRSLEVVFAIAESSRAEKAVRLEV